MRSLLALGVLLALVAPARGGTIAAGGIDVHLPLASMRELQRAGTVLQRYDFSCGSAAIATLLTQHYGQAVDEDEVLRAMYASGDQPRIQKEGFSMLDMKRYLASQGYEADGFRQTLDKLAEARLPAIVLVDEHGYRHFVVIKGLAPGRVVVGDPARGTRAIARDAFEDAWVGGLLFVIHNRTQQARFNRAADWRAAPRAPLASGVNRLGTPGLDLPKRGPGDF